MSDTIKISHASLEETPKGDIILRGVLDASSLKLIRYADYQREVLPLKSLTSLIKALTDGDPVPDVTLGMRGGNCFDRGGFYYLQEDTYAIDGQQRIAAAMHVMRSGLNAEPHLGCIVYFNTTEESEKALFTILNTRGYRLSSNVLIRNMQTENQAVEMVFSLTTTDRDFALYDRVSWQQRMKRSELITATALMKVVGMMHSAFGPGLSSHLDEAARGVERTMRDVVGRKIMAQNIKTFFDIIDGAWGIRSVAYKESAVHLKHGFLMSLAWVFANYRSFWDENRRLVMSPDLRKKLSTFPIQDGTVVAMSNGTAHRHILGRLIAEHLNSGRRTRRLIPFKDSEVVADESEGAGAKVA